jgi:hypothetical protein
MPRARRIVLLVALGLSACLHPVGGREGDDASVLDASLGDAGGLDASLGDAGGLDASGLDGSLGDAGGLDADSPDTGASYDGGVPDGAISCQVDGDCPADSVCDYTSDPSPTRACVPGCHESSQCGSDQVCHKGPCALCATCACVGQCESIGAACTSDAACGPGTVCEPSTGCGPNACVAGCHEGAQCGAGRNCLRPQCITCGPCPGECVCGGSTCASTLECVARTTFCQSGCCIPCPASDPVTCPLDQCSYSSGLTPETCPTPPVCAACVDCPTSYAPVCTASYATFANECEAKREGQQVLHLDACLSGEGLPCGPAATCPAGQYCRDRCAMVGACATAQDCPAGLSPKVCAKTSHWNCVSNQCQFVCGP